MKNKALIEAVRMGLLDATGHSLPAEHFYKFCRYKKAVRAAYDSFAESEKNLLAEAGITQEDMSERPDGKVTIAPKLPDGSPDIAKLQRYKVAMDALLNEDVNLGEIKTIPIDNYKGLYDENRKEVSGRTIDIFSNMIVEDFIIETLFKEE